MVGYTNAGKSSLLNALTGSGVLVQDQLFTTLDATTRRLELPGNGEALLSDTVGFVRDLPHQLVESFRSTLEEAADADLIVHIVDASAEQPERQVAAVRATLEEIGAHEIPELLVLNKIDAMSPDAVARVRNRYEGAVAVSAHSGAGLEDLAARIESALAPDVRDLELLIPFDRGDLVARVHEYAEVVSESHEAEGTHLKARVPMRHVPSLAQFQV